MSDKNLPVPHKVQKEDGYCLPACVEMVLSYLGVSSSQEQLGKKLGIRPSLGIPAFKIKELNSRRLAVIYGEGTLSDIVDWLQQNVPIIAFVQAGELPHWQGRQSQHAIVIIGMSEQMIYLLDPATKAHPTPTPIGDFMLAWDEMDNRYATIQLRQ
jgi:ABC-type bacteriocin/lantibiotic exporter with double-glycine peptidase domain